MLVPGAAGVLSAYGIATGDIRFGFARSLFANSARFDFGAVNAVLAALEEEGSAYLDRMRMPAERREMLLTTEARYAGQVWQLTLKLPHRRIDGAAGLAELMEAFHQLHEQQYAVRANDPVEFTEWNLLAIGRLAEDRVVTSPASPAIAVGPARHRTAFVKAAGGAVDLPVHDLAGLNPGARLRGPALVESRLTVTLVPPDATATIVADGGVMIDLT